jgi:hypothetical protein
MPATTYTAIIRWRGPDPALELETRHTGFASPEEAALYANGIPPRTPDGLHLFSDGSAVFVLDDDTELPCNPDQLTAWTLPPKCATTDGLTVVDDDDYEPFPRGELVLRFAAHGDYLQAQYGVLDPNDMPVDVRVDWDDNNRLRVTVVDLPAPLPLDPKPELSFGALPDA